MHQSLSEPDVWSDHLAAQRLSQHLGKLQHRADFWQRILSDADDLSQLVEIADEHIAEELLVELSQLERRVNTAILDIALSGEHDHRNAIVSIYAGAGGTEAQWWAETLTGMYCRWANLTKRPNNVVNTTAGSIAGIKHSTIEIGGDHAYGRLASEAGIHRLSRVSDFDSSGKRHTSFARVEILPAIPEEQFNVSIPKSDIRFDAYHASGNGGQAVNKLATAVRLTHIPTGIVAASQSERSQGQNRAIAMRILLSRLTAKWDAEKEAEARKMRGEQPDPAWGNQIRSYILNPSQLVNDHRTGHIEYNAHAVLEGQLDEFMQAYLLQKISTNAKDC